MTLETLKRGNELAAEIIDLEARIARTERLTVDDATTIKVRSHGLDFEIPQNLIKAEAYKKTDALNAQLLALREEFNSL